MLSTQSVSASLQHIKAGKLRALATFGAKRSKALPDVPTMKELGYDLEYYLWVGMFAPKGTPAPIISTSAPRLDKAASETLFTTAVANLGLEQGYLSAADFAKFWDVDAKRAEDAVHAIGRVQG